ncbi:MAG: hypothetical protein WA159_06910 [Variovorax sp.]
MTALAHKIARIAWSILRSDKQFEVHHRMPLAAVEVEPEGHRALHARLRAVVLGVRHRDLRRVWCVFLLTTLMKRLSVRRFGWQ